ncbi:MAG: AI-2E family transporter [Candidatus Nanopelagicales bacterium]
MSETSSTVATVVESTESVDPPAGTDSVGDLNAGTARVGDGGGGTAPVDDGGQSGPGRRWSVSVDPRWIRRSAITVLLLVVVVWIGDWAFSRLGNFIFLLLLAWLFGIAMDPIVSYLERHGIGRRLATLLTLILFAGLSIGFLLAFGSLLVSQLSQLITSVPASLVDIVDWVNRTFNTTFDAAEIQQQLNVSPTQVANIAANLAGGAFGIVSSLVGFIFQFFTLLLFGYYFAAEGPKIRDTVASWLPQRRQLVFNQVWEIAIRKTGGFVVSRLLLAVLLSVVSSAFFYLIDIPYWLPMGIWTGVISQFIPTLGTYLGLLLPCLVAVFNDPWDVVWIIIFGTVYQQLENYYLAPKISAKTMDIHPAIAFASVIVGAALFGPIGALIGIPIAAMLLAVVETYGKRYELLEQHAIEKKKHKKGENSPPDSDGNGTFSGSSNNDPDSGLEPQPA